MKQTNDSKILNTMVGGSRFINRVSDNGVVIDDSFVLTDNTLNFEVPVEKIEEGLLTEGMNWLFGVNDEEIRLEMVHKHKVTEEKKKEIHDEITKSFLDSDDEDVETL